MSKVFSRAVPAHSLPAAALSGKHRKFLTKLTAVISGGMFIDGFILGCIGIVMPAITRDLHLSPIWQGLIGASALIGIFIGGPLGGWLADRVGRRPMFTVDLAIFLVGSAAQFFVAEAWQLFVVRLVMGIAIGADYSIGWPLLAEFAPARLRGKLLAILELVWYVGYLVSYAIGWGLTESSMASWQVILGLSTVPTVIVFLMRLGTPESPRWLMSRGKVAEAKALAKEYLEPDELGELQPSGASEKYGFRSLFSPGYFKTTFFVSMFWVCNVTPYFAIGAFAPIVLERLGLKEGLTGGLVLNGVAVLGTIIAVMLIEKVGRRVLAIPPFFVSAVALMSVALFSDVSSELILVCFFTFSLVNAISTVLTGVYPGEVFPTEIRGIGVGVATAVSRVGAAMGTFLLPVIIETYGVGAAMMIAAGISLVGGVISYALAPETKGKLLSEASAARK
ncbi:MFS transporter [Burkholderia sp. Ac-20345]|uniref:MFS transporter n=1 Tax=Burkholderia sp. Ac-20345 TaxID=2703891 RepID=UPI0032179DD8